jgi:hypothetical protein
MSQSERPLGLPEGVLLGPQAGARQAGGLVK